MSDCYFVVPPVTRNKLFLLDKTGEMQILRPQIIFVLNFNQKQHWWTKHVRCCVLLTLLSIPVNIQHQGPSRFLNPSDIQVLWSQQCRFFVFKLLCRISRWKPGHTRPNQVFCYRCVRTATAVFFIYQEQERPITFTIFIEMYP